MMEYRQYPDIRASLNTGDVVAFLGRGLISGGIRLLAGIPSHVALVARVGADGGERVELCESTSMRVNGERIIGVQRTYLSERLAYPGRVWVLPLAQPLVTDAQKEQFAATLAWYADRPYDFFQVACLGLRKALPFLFPLKENDRALFCSEMVAFVFKAAGILPQIGLNASMVTPRDIVRFRIYADRYYQIAGTPKELDGFNSVDATARAG